MSGVTSKIPVSSLVIFGVVFAAILALILLTHGSVVALGPRWIVTGVWIAATVGLGIRDLVMGNANDLDSTPIDRWTAIHATAGLVFGLWYVPLVAVLAITIGWEVFEALAPGFGDKEVFLNRVMDIVSAVVVWFVTVGVIILVNHTSFPLLHG